MASSIITYDYMSGEYEVDDQLLLRLIGDETAQERLLLSEVPSMPRKVTAKTWWGERWISAYERRFSPDVVDRARSLARGRSIIRLYLAAGKLSGLVMTGSDYYMSHCVPTVRFPVFPLANWERALTTFAGEGRRIAALLNGKLPEETSAILSAEGIAPFDFQSIRTDKTCQDWHTPCTHTLALGYAFTTLIDANPLLLFVLNGLWLPRAMALLRGEPYTPPADTAEAELDTGDTFWLGRRLPTVPPLQNATPDFSRLSPKAGLEFPRFMQKMAEAAQKLPGRTPDPALHIEKAELPQPAERPIPSFMEKRYEELIAEFDAACAAHLTPEFLVPGQAMIRALCVSSLAPLKGRASHWIAAVVWALETLNYAEPPHAEEEIGGWFRTAAKSVVSRGNTILSVLQAQPHDPRWSFSTQANPWACLVKVNGVLIDLRRLPPEVQQAAVAQGVITEEQFDILMQGSKETRREGEE